MSTQAPVRRRDGRFLFSTSEASVEFIGAGDVVVCAKLLDLSVAGLAFETDDAECVPDAGSVVRDVSVRVGACDLRGTLAIKGVRTAPTGQTRCGCLFYPESREAELALMALITGLESSGGVSADRPPVARTS